LWDNLAIIIVTVRAFINGICKWVEANAGIEGETLLARDFR